VNLWSVLERAARSHPRKLAASEGETHLTYAELRERCRSLAAGLGAAGVARGDRLAVLEPNSLAYLELYWAAAALGAILVPLNTRLAPRELAGILRHSGARALVAHGSFAGLLGEVIERGATVDLLLWTRERPATFAHAGLDIAEFLQRPAGEFRAEELADSEIAQLYYTSGTTGEPKGVMLTHGNVTWHALGARAEFKLTDSDVWIHVAPMFHLADAWASFALVWAGGAQVFAPRFDEAAVLEAFAHHGVTLTNLVPTMLLRLIDFEGAAARQYPALRMILSGGAPIAPTVVRRIIETFRCEYVQTYGMTETSPFLTLSLLKSHLLRAAPQVQFAYRAKTGRAFATVELEVIGEDGQPVAPDGIAVGEIRARGATVTPGYWNDPAASARAFIDGWLCTGDLATIDSEGYLQIVDRKKDMIISGGEKIYSTEVESVLYAHGAVAECAVYGVADPLWGERVEAAVVLRSGSPADGDALLLHARQHLAGFKVPRQIRFVAELPKTATGKISKRELRDRGALGH